MNIRIGIVLLALGICLPAAAEIETVVRAVETSTAGMTVPTSANARLSFKPCAGECDADSLSVRLTPATVYRVNGEFTDFPGFRKAFYNLPRDKETYALVSYDAKSQTTTSIEIAENAD